MLPAQFVVEDKEYALTCPTCNKKMASSDGLRKHIRKMHINTWTKHRCDACGWTYSSTYTLMHHKCVRPPKKIPSGTIKLD